MPDLVAETERLLVELTADGLVARALGGVAVALRCPSARAPSSLARACADIDLVTARRSAAGIPTVLARHGFRPERRFNALHGHSRLLFTGVDGLHLDVFVETFEMCHRLPLGSRLDIHPQTVSLADLLLTKLQVAELNRKDVTDAAALLLDHPVSDGEHGINAPYLVGVLGRDWGWWRTVTENLDRLSALVGDIDLEPRQSELLGARVAELTEAVDAGPKTLRWRLRAKIGDRAPWRDDPEESL